MKDIDYITNTNDKTRATLLRKLANLPTENQLQVIKNATNYQFKNQDKLRRYSNSKKLYISIIVSINNFIEYKFNRLDIELQKQKLRKRENIKVQKIKNKFKKQSKVKDKLLSKNTG
jgi:hypothetical protein